MCSEEGILMENLRTIVLGIQWEWFILLFALVILGGGNSLVELLDADGGSNIGYSNGVSDGNRYGNVDGYTLAE